MKYLCFVFALLSAIACNDSPEATPRDGVAGENGNSAGSSGLGPGGLAGMNPGGTAGNVGGANAAGNDAGGIGGTYAEIGGTAGIGESGGMPAGGMAAEPDDGSGIIDLSKTAPRADPASSRQANVPEGMLLKGRTFNSTIYNGPYQYDLYVPAQLDENEPAPVIVYTDGDKYWRTVAADVVMDNLIHNRQMPAAIGIFVYHKNRDREYVSNTDEFGRFLTTEMFPEVAKTYALTDDPELRVIVGHSSGGLGAFALGWDMNDQFRKVMIDSPSFAAFAKKDYPALVRTTDPPKHLRVAMLVGTMDLVDRWGSWLTMAQAMEKELDARAYDFRSLTVIGNHAMSKTRPYLPENLRWLWRDWQE